MLGHRAAPSFAARPLGLLTVLVGVLLIRPMHCYNYLGDELYFLAAGRRLAVSYADQGPLVPLVAHVADLVASGSLLALRIPAELMCLLAMVLSAAVAYELGGGRRAQLLAAVGYATTPLILTQNVLSTFAFDTALLATITWLLVRWTRVRRDWLLLVAGLVAAVDIQVKWLVPVVWLCLGLGVALGGPRDMLRRTALWIASLAMLASSVPGVAWQAAHGWPQLTMSRVIGIEQDVTGGGRLACLPQMVGLAGVLGGLLAVTGVWGAARSPTLRHARFLFAALLLLTIVVLVSDGRPYYIAGLFPAIFGVGGVHLAEMDKRSWWRHGERYAIAGSALTIACLLLLLPLPASSERPVGTPREVVQRVVLYGPGGWSGLLAAVADGWRAIPAEQRARAVVVAENYWQASAIEEFGPRYGIPVPFSPNRGFGFFAPPPDSAEIVLYIGVSTAAKALRSEYTDVHTLAHADDPLGYPGVDRFVTVWLCTGMRQPWSIAWPKMRTLTLDQGV